MGFGITYSSGQDCVVGGLYIDAIMLDANGSNNFDTDQDGDFETNDEFVQICNSFGSSVDLSSFSLSDNSNTFVMSGSLAAGECVVLIGDYDSATPAPFQYLESTLALSNSGETLTLSNGVNECTIAISESCGAYTNCTVWDNESDGCITINNEVDCSLSPTDLGSPLFLYPVEMLSFTVNSENNSAVLNWSTASEVDNDYFMVEKSKDGKNFEAIGKVEGNGTTTQIQSYEFKDYNLSLNNYYRLNQVDFDGKNEYSNIISLRTKLDDKIDLVNTRVDQKIIINSGFNESVQDSIVSSNGSVIKQFMIEGGNNSIDVSGISNGIYYISIVSYDQIITEKIVKM